MTPATLAELEDCMADQGLTPEEQLDRARAEEAVRLTTEKSFEMVRAAATRAAMLARTGWTPTDRDLIRAREIVAEIFPAHAHEILRGEWDKRNGLYANVESALSALKAARGGGA